MSNKQIPPVKVIFDPEPIRMKLGLTKTGFANLIGISKNGYSGLSNNPTQVRVDTIGKIISATGCDIKELYRVEPV
jgi:DNA-binding XRE family transcriptional regulator